MLRRQQDGYPLPSTSIPARGLSSGLSLGLDVRRHLGSVLGGYLYSAASSLFVCGRGVLNRNLTVSLAANPGFERLTNPKGRLQKDKEYPGRAEILLFLNAST